MSRFAIVFRKSAKKSLTKLPKNIQNLIGEKIETLKNDPYPQGVQKVQSEAPKVYRIRSGKYRVIYQVQNDRLIILVLRIAHRSSAYMR